MIQLIQQLDTTVYAPIIYIVGESDVTSIPRLQRNDDKNTTDDHPTITASAQVYTLPRAREVHQSYLSSIFTTLYSTYKTLQLLYTIRPNLIMTNGPGTCVPLVYCAFVLRLWFSLMNDRTIFIESICRVKTLSLSGKLVYPIVDSFMVHWPNLMERYGMVENCDVLVYLPAAAAAAAAAPYE
ncbi:hypothetical protein ACHAWC_001232 [Mediolabrus comicus]